MKPDTKHCCLVSLYPDIHTHKSLQDETEDRYILINKNIILFNVCITGTDHIYDSVNNGKNSSLVVYGNNTFYQCDICRTNGVKSSVLFLIVDSVSGHTELTYAEIELKPTTKQKKKKENKGKLKHNSLLL